MQSAYWLHKLIFYHFLPYSLPSTYVVLAAPPIQQFLPVLGTVKLFVSLPVRFFPQHFFCFIDTSSEIPFSWRGPFLKSLPVTLHPFPVFDFLLPLFVALNRYPECYTTIPLLWWQAIYCFIQYCILNTKKSTWFLIGIQ